MNAKAIADSFSREGGSREGSAYLVKERLFESLDSVAKKDSQRIAPKWSDLARLHMAIRARKVFTVLEFGVGFSTVVMGDALKKNRDDWELARRSRKSAARQPFRCAPSMHRRLFSSGRRQWCPRI
jgi:predicted O-methyltransferase YrrM